MQLAVSCGADVIGLVSAMPSGPGPIDEMLIAEIARAAPPHIETFLLTSLVSSDEIIRQHMRCKTTAIQLCDRLESGAHERIRRGLPGIKLVQVIHVTSSESIDEALSLSSVVDALLLDSGNQSLAVKELGGTGRTHDWELSREIRERVHVPVWLAGGLNSGNAKAAVEVVKPYGIDICNGVRELAGLSAGKVRALIVAVS